MKFIGYVTDAVLQEPMNLEFNLKFLFQNLPHLILGHLKKKLFELGKIYFKVQNFPRIYFQAQKRACIQFC